jgi:nitrile hydratase accessory protein
MNYEQEPTHRRALAAIEGEHAEAVFAEPWEARAFALALTLSRSGQFSWDEFRDRLIAEIARADAETTRDRRATAAESPRGPYYECWLAALEQLLREKELLHADEIERRASAIAASPPAPTKAQSCGPVRIA